MKTETSDDLALETVNARTVIVHVGRALDFRNASDFKTLCGEQIREGVRNFILDFSQTEVLDSTGLGKVFSVYRQVSPLDGQVVFAASSLSVQVVVNLTRSYKVFRQFSSIESAKANVH